jgi:hypothetical protein
MVILAVVFAAGAAREMAAQSTESQSSGKSKPVALKLPDGYMPGEFPEKRMGKVLLNPKKPAGMFIVYPKADEGPDVLPNVLKSMVVEMFYHDSKTPVEWTTAPLPAHQGIENETGTLYSTSNDKMELQLASYMRTVGGATIMYGYYGMRHKGGKSKKDDALFIDSSGKGVEDFDKFWQSIHASK